MKLLGRIAEVMPAQEGVSSRTGNAWKSQDGTRWFNEVRISNVERAGVQTNQPKAAQQAPQAANDAAAGNQSTPQPNAPQSQQKPAEEDPNDDLPF